MKTKLPYFLAFVAVLTLACSVSTVTPIPAPAIQPTAAPVNNAAAVIRIPQDMPGRVFIVSASALTIRSEPSTGAAELGYAYEGDELTYAGDVEAGTGDCTLWRSVEWHGVTGWACDAFVYQR